METENCPYCGTVVKKQNLQGHYERVHPKTTGTVSGQRGVPRPAFVRSHRRRNVAVLSLIALAVIGVGVIAAQPQAKHIHVQLSATINGSPFVIPADIGINSTLYVDHSFDQYGYPPHAPLHTHDATGTIHVEPRVARDFTLQEFLRIWGQRFDATSVLGHPVDPGHRAYMLVDGVEKSASEVIVFRDGQQITLVCGP